MEKTGANSIATGKKGMGRGRLYPFLLVSALLHGGLLWFGGEAPRVDGAVGRPPTLVTLVTPAPGPVGGGPSPPSSAGEALVPAPPRIPAAARSLAPRKKPLIPGTRKQVQAAKAKEAREPAKEVGPPSRSAVLPVPQTGAENGPANQAREGKPSPETGPGRVSAEEEPITASFGIREGPRVLRLVQPQYPQRALRLKKEGLVLVHLHLDRNGALHRARVVEKAGYGFDEAAMAAVSKSTFQPATRNGRPVPCLALLPVRFVLPAGR